MAEELETLSERLAQPSWWTALMADYKAGMSNVFVLTGNVWDYVDHPTTDLTLRQYLEARLGRTHTVASFAPDQGITFPGNELAAKEARTRFDAALGIAAEAVDPATAAIRAATGQADFGGGDQEPLPKDAPGAISLLIEFARAADMEDEAAQIGLVGPKGDRQEIRKNVAVVIERADLIFPPEDKARLAGGDRALLSLVHRAGTDLSINRRKNMVLILAPSLEEVHPDLRLASSGIRAIEVDVPDHDQRLAYVVRTLPKRRAVLDGISEVELASETAGLNRRAIEDIAMRAAARGGVLTRELVKERKAQLIAAEYAEVLEVLEADVTFDQVGGHDRLKSFLRERVLPQMRDPQLRGDCPMGLLFAGPSGTGKTFLARALAHESGFNAVALAADKIRGSFVGESERKLAKAIKGIQALSPCILFIDEIDQKVKRVTGGGGGGGDSVESNIFGRLLEFFSDTSHRGQILLVAATNRPDQIDAALKRPGRIDIKAPLLPPNDEQERAAALAALITRHDVAPLSDDELLDLGRETDSWTQAELEGLVVAARSIARITKLPSLEAFREALEETAPATDDIALHTRLAIAVCNNRKLVPDKYRTQVGKQLAKRRPATSPVGAGRTAIEAAPEDDGFDFGDEV